MAKDSDTQVDTVDKPTAELCWGKLYDAKDNACKNKCGLSDTCKVALAKVEALLRPLKRELFPGSYPEDEVATETDDSALSFAADNGKKQQEAAPKQAAQKASAPKPAAPKPPPPAPKPKVIDDDDAIWEASEPVAVVDEDGDADTDIGEPTEDGSRNDEDKPSVVVDDDDSSDPSKPTEQDISSVVDDNDDGDDSDISELDALFSPSIVLPEIGDQAALAEEDRRSVDTDDIWDNIDDKDAV